jgi:hypothetical protein
VTVGQLLGATLQPVSIAGYSGALTSPPLASVPHLDFGPRGKWGGSDGCNSVAGTYRVGTGGSFRLVEHFSTAVGCFSRIPLPLTAARLEVRDRRYTFYARDERRLAQYVGAASAVTSVKPKVAVVPNAGLVDGQRVRVRVTGFGIGAKVWLSECATASDASDLGCGLQLPQQTLLVTGNDRSGSATFVVRNHAAVKGYDTADPRACTSACVVVATQGDEPVTHDLGHAFAPIAFRAR